MKKKPLVFLFFLVVSLFFSLKVFSEEIDMKISFPGEPEIAVHFETIAHQGKGRYLLTLSDGSQWLLRDRNPDEIFVQIESEWQTGDEIRIAARKEKERPGKYILKNVRNSRVCLTDLEVFWADSSRVNFLEKVDEHGYALCTRGGLQWAMGLWGSFTARGWTAGDRIIINKSRYSSEEDYLLINVDKRTNVWASLITWR